MTAHFWYFREMHTVDSFLCVSREYIGCYAVDTSIEVGQVSRTGQWGPVVWTNIPPENLPPEFRVALLVMGIPT